MKRVIIVGGGSAGWISACYLDAALNRSGKTVSITLVESPSVGRIGVGEATIPTIRETIKRIGLDEATFIHACSATFKQGILFEDWGYQGHSYFHPFDRYPGSGYFDDTAVRWLFSDRKHPFADLVSAQPKIAMQGLAPKGAEHPDFVGPFPYAYHMDAEQFAGYLAEVGRSRGIDHILDDVQFVRTDAEGLISCVTTAGGADLVGDLYIDCTGFAALLIKGALHVPSVDY